MFQPNRPWVTVIEKGLLYIIVIALITGIAFVPGCYLSMYEPR